MDEGAPPGQHQPSALNALIAASIRRERERAGLSMAELARRAGLGKSTLSQLEAGLGNPSAETLWALASTLGVPFSRLVDPPRGQVRVVRAGEGPVTFSEKASYAATLLATTPPGGRHDIYWIAAQPGPPRVSEPHTAGIVEHVMIAAGQALAGPSDGPVRLNPGDYITYPGDALHIFEALEPDTSAVMVLEYA